MGDDVRDLLNLRADAPPAVVGGPGMPRPGAGSLPPLPYRSNGGGFWTFHKMISPILIQVFFWIGVVAAVLWGVFLIVTSMEYRNLGQALLGLGLIVLGPLVLRVQCEVAIIFFRIHETLVEIRDGRA